MIWDGLPFFGFDDTKLARLKGVPVDFCSKFSSIKWIILTFSSAIAISIVIFLELNRFGQVKS